MMRTPDDMDEWEAYGWAMGETAPPLAEWQIRQGLLIFATLPKPAAD